MAKSECQRRPAPPGGDCCLDHAEKIMQAWRSRQEPARRVVVAAEKRKNKDPVSEAENPVVEGEEWDQEELGAVIENGDFS